MPPFNPFTLYPPPPGSTAHPERPWWRRVVIQQELLEGIRRVTGEVYNWVRSDGRLIRDCRWRETAGVSGYYVGETFNVLALGPYELEEMDRIDAREPMKRPAICPGQVWAWRNDGDLALEYYGNVKLQTGDWICAQTDDCVVRSGSTLFGGELSRHLRTRVDRDEALLVFGPNDQRWAPVGWTSSA